IEVDNEEVEIYGNKEYLEDIDEITANIDLDNVAGSTEKDITFEVPDKVTKVSPKDTTATITVK
ncbi:MAG: YbbR-like domain-containing protein, partial [Staphylococcus equorum]|nr:YbbR-like domain-containing protein [Staphylococcus equorum]